MICRNMRQQLKMEVFPEQEWETTTEDAFMIIHIAKYDQSVMNRRSDHTCRQTKVKIPGRDHFFKSTKIDSRKMPYPRSALVILLIHVTDTYMPNYRSYFIISHIRFLYLQVKGSVKDPLSTGIILIHKCMNSIFGILGARKLLRQ